MDKHESKYFYTASLMDEALLSLIEKKDYEYITVKEICQKAGVNRSTFYLHYENIDDLLKETIENGMKKLMSKYALPKGKGLSGDVRQNATLFFTPEWTVPYLQYIQENKTLFILANKYQDLFSVRKTTTRLFKELFSPILDRFDVSEKEKKYIVSFYMSGIHKIISVWIEGGFEDSIEYVADLIYRYVQR